MKNIIFKLSKNFLLVICFVLLFSIQSFANNNFDDKKYIGGMANLGISGIAFDNENIERSPSFSFQIGASYFSFANNWFAAQYSLSYRKFFIKTDEKIETYDLISFSFGMILNISKFLINIDIIGGYSISSNDEKSGLLWGIGGGMGYIIFTNKKIMIPIRGIFELYYLPNLTSGLVYGAYIKVDILFRIN